jgi:hypothetical protein
MKVRLELTVDARLAADIRVFYAKAMQGSEQAACLHPMTMAFLSTLPKQIDERAEVVAAKIAAGHLDVER